MSDAPVADIIVEAQRLLDEAARASVTIRLLGGLAVHEHTPKHLPTLAREYNDIDLITTKREGARVADFLTRMGYEPDPEFNALNGHRRLLFYDTDHGRQLDVFVGSFEMCHALPLTDRLDAHATAIPLAELLLTKFQVAELNEKDEIDLVTMLLHHDVSDSDEQTINAARVAALCAADWGLWRTTKMNVERLRDRLDELVADPEERRVVADRLNRLWQRIEEQPKSRRWKMRNRVGDKVRWYEQPEEVA
jgi:hypothetical protein